MLKAIITRLAFVAALIYCSAAWAVTGETAEFVKLADDVYAYVGKRNDANAMVIVTNQGVVLVDTGNSQPDTRDLAAKIKSRDEPACALGCDQPISWRSFWRLAILHAGHGHRA